MSLHTAALIAARHGMLLFKEAGDYESMVEAIKNAGGMPEGITDEQLKEFAAVVNITPSYIGMSLEEVSTEMAKRMVIPGDE